MTTHRRSLLKQAGLVAASLPFVPEAWAQTLGYPRTLQGPMVGAPSSTSITVWARVSGAFDVVLEVATRRDFADVRQSPPVRADQSSDFCAHLRLDGLSPAARHFYRLRIDGVLDRYQPLPYSTRTAPRGRASFRAAFGSCARLQIEVRLFEIRFRRFGAETAVLVEQPGQGQRTESVSVPREEVAARVQHGGCHGE